MSNQTNSAAQPRTNAESARRYVEILKAIKASPEVIAAAEREAERIEAEERTRQRSGTR